MHRVATDRLVAAWEIEKGAAPSLIDQNLTENDTALLEISIKNLLGFLGNDLHNMH